MEVQRFRANLQGELLQLREDLLSGRAAFGNYHYFYVFEPKQRLICAAAFRERVLHHALMNLCEPVFERYLIHDTYACRKGKGAHRAAARAQTFARKNRLCLKIDIAKYFDSIDHSILERLLVRRFKERRLLDVFHRIISSYETAPGKGVPIGNLTSQYFANHYLGLLDHFVREQLRIRHYVRYMDDMLLWGDDRAGLKRRLALIRDFLRQELALELNSNVGLYYTDSGVNFLGYRVYPFDLRLTKRSRSRFARKFRRYEQQYMSGLWDMDRLARHMLPLVAFTAQAASGAFRRNVIKRFGAVS